MKRTLLMIFSVLLTACSCSERRSQSETFNLEKAKEILESDKPDEKEAMRLLDKQLELTPNNPDAFFMRGTIHFKAKENAEAIRDFTSAIDYHSRKQIMPRLLPYWWRARVYQRAEDFESSRADYDMAIRYAKRECDDRKDLSDIFLDRAQMFYEQGLYDLSDADYNEILSIDGLNPTAMIGLVRNKIVREDYASALEILERCAKVNDKYSEIYHYRMLANSGLGNKDAAIDDALEYVVLEQSDLPYKFKEVLGAHFSYAIARLSEKLNDDTENTLVWRYLRAKTNEWRKDYRNAITDYKFLLDQYGYDGELCSALAEAYYEIGMKDKAIAEISRAIENEPARIHLWDCRGRFYNDAGDYANALKDFRHIIEMAPSNGYGYYRTGWCHELSGDDATALKYYNDGIDLDKSHPYLFLMRGELLLKQGKIEDARADFEMVVQMDTVVMDGTCRQYALHFLGRDEEALEWMSDLIGKEPEDPGHYYDKTCLLCRMGKNDDALAAFEKCLSMGYTHFGHIEHDDDLDPIRNLPGFKKLVSEYKNRIVAMNDSNGNEEARETLVSEIPLRKKSSGTYEIACNINELPLNMILDTGASTVTISSTEANFMLKNGYLKNSDIKGKEYSRIANGDIVEGTVITLKEIKVGDIRLRNVDASVVHSQKAPLLLGQSVMERFGTITIDNINSKLIIKSK